MDRKGKVFLIAVVVLAITSVVGVVLSSGIKSPAVIAAETAPPTPSLITSSVERKVLVNNLVFRGVFAERSSMTINPSGLSGSSSPIITQIYHYNQNTVYAGDVLAAISGNPLFIMQGNIPSYRNIAPGDQGPDVAELQRGLIALGYSIGEDQIGTYGNGTKKAVAAYYKHIGFSPVTAGSQSAIQEAQQTVSSDQSTLLAAENTLYQATTTTTTLAESPSVVSPGSMGNTGVEELQLQLQNDRQALSQAEQSLSQAELAFGPEVPMAEVIFTSCVRLEVASVSASVGDPPEVTLLVCAVCVIRTVHKAVKHNM